MKHLSYGGQVILCPRPAGADLMAGMGSYLSGSDHYMNPCRKIRQLGEIILICLGFSIIPFLPRIWILGLSRFLGNMAYRFSRKLREVAMANLNVAFHSDISTDEKISIARDSFKTFALLILDIFWFGLFTKRRIASYVKFDSSFECFYKLHPSIVIGAHIGNWEVLGLAVAFRNAPCVSIATPLENPFADAMLNRFRCVTGSEVALKEGAIKTLLRTLNEGGRVALLLDQNTLPEEGGEFVDFFGLPAPMSKAVALLHERTAADMVFLFCIADNDGCYKTYAQQIISKSEPDVGSNVITQAVASVMEENISNHPGKWLWMYKRWKFVPKGAPKDKYPFYAKK
ncbi:lysophospholipid acyltransferase family protein [Verrucomicrobiota bacterium]